MDCILETKQLTKEFKVGLKSEPSHGAAFSPIRGVKNRAIRQTCGASAFTPRFTPHRTCASLGRSATSRDQVPLQINVLGGVWGWQETQSTELNRHPLYAHEG